MPKGMNRPLLLLCPFVKLKLTNGETIEGKANYLDDHGMEIYLADRDEFRWIGNAEIVSKVRVP